MFHAIGPFAVLSSAQDRDRTQSAQRNDESVNRHHCIQSAERLGTASSQIIDSLGLISDQLPILIFISYLLKLKLRLREFNDSLAINGVSPTGSSSQ